MTQPIETAALDTPERKVDTLLAHYGLSHTHPVNELIHYIAIPAIMLSLAGLMFAIHPAVVLVFFGASLVYYARLSGPFTICMLLGTSILLRLWMPSTSVEFWWVLVWLFLWWRGFFNSSVTTSKAKNRPFLKISSTYGSGLCLS